MTAYKIVGPRAIKGVEPGGTVDIDDDAQADALIVGGHIEPAAKRKPATKRKPKKAEPEPEQEEAE